MKSNAACGLTGIEIVVILALTMLFAAVISPVLSTHKNTPKPDIQQAGFLEVRPTRYQIDKVDEGILFAAAANPLESNDSLMAARKEALIQAGKIQPDNPENRAADVLAKSATAGLCAALRQSGMPKSHPSISRFPIKLAVADSL